MSRPYLIVPQLIKQPTWGGDYILRLKKWNKKQYQGVKIGQSYELSGSSRLATYASHSDDLQDMMDSNNDQCILISEIEPVNLLIKLNQAFGNSFQLHIKPNLHSARWKPKPESWYFLEDGLITLGVCHDTDLGQYKNTCVEIDVFMNNLSKQVKNSEISLMAARQQAKNFVQKKNPWQFVNKYRVAKYNLIDLSIGGIHHSWEEDMVNNPNGNIVFEVQLEAGDDKATIRAFDQGKIKDDGSIRKLNIDDYFNNLNNDPSHNDISFLKRAKQNGNLLKTQYYTEFLRDYTSVVVKKGNSCFLPSSATKYIIQKNEPKSVVLRTYPIYS